MGLLKDGSNQLKESINLIESSRNDHLRLNKNKLNDKRSKINFGDEDLIVNYIREINRIGADQDRKVVFFIPPVYETPRDSLVNQIFDKALIRLKDVSIIDHRRLYLSKEYFASYDHPNFKYYEF